MIYRLSADHGVGHREDVYDQLKSSIEDMIGQTGELFNIVFLEELPIEKK